MSQSVVCNLGPYTENIGGQCYEPCRKGYKADGFICDKVDFNTVPVSSRDPVRARRMTICDPGWSWDGDKLCFPMCPFGFETRDDLCVAVPHSYRRRVRPRLYRAPVSVSLPDFADAANREKAQSDFKHVVGETIADAKALIRSMYPTLSIRVYPNHKREKVLKSARDMNRIQLFYDKNTGLVTHIPVIG